MLTGQEGTCEDDGYVIMTAVVVSWVYTYVRAYQLVCF